MMRLNPRTRQGKRQIEAVAVVHPDEEEEGEEGEEAVEEAVADADAEGVSKGYDRRWIVYSAWTFEVGHVCECI